MISVIIPTKNRPNDLGKAVASILDQTRCPDEIVIVDQSHGFESRRIVENLLSKPNLRFRYIHDQEITGLVDAKRVGVKHATGDFIFFLEDDIILESDYIEQLQDGFTRDSGMIGCSGIITNPPPASALKIFLFDVFHRSIFADPRISIYRKSNGRGNDLIPSAKLSGGLSAWKKEVFVEVEFDTVNGFHMYEDIDFSTRVSYHFGGGLYINPNACLAHHCSPLNRDVLGARQKRKIIESIVYYKKRHDLHGAKLSLIWLLFGIGLESLFESFSARSLGPVHGYFKGLSAGFSKNVFMDGSKR
jgi:glycosyltransferase involved in cell wall biosynthesis